MNITNFVKGFEISNLLILLIFLTPGFISLKVYDSIIPSEKRIFSKSLLEIGIYSAINYAFFSWLIIILIKFNLFETNIIIFSLIVVLIVVIGPILWPIAYNALLTTSFIKKIKPINPIPLPWDFVFMQRKPHWIIVHTKDGRQIGGRYDSKSFTSSFPHKEQIYLEELWRLDKKGAFVKQVDRTEGILIMGDEISFIEFFNY